MKLIDKDTVVVVVEKRIKELQNLHRKKEEKLDFLQKTAIRLCIDECKVILSFLDTLEVKDFELTWEDVAWIVNKTILLCKVESTLTTEDICKDVLRQFKAKKGE